MEEEDDTSISTNTTTATPLFTHQEEDSYCPLSFEKAMKSAGSRVSRSQNTYFMDGGNRFISVNFIVIYYYMFFFLTSIKLPSLGNTNTKAASHISRVFEDWLQNKLHNHSVPLPILEDSVELLAEDIMNKLKSRQSIKGMTGLSQILIKIRAGDVYTTHQPFMNPDMEDFFQQFPLFVEIIIYTMPKDHDTFMDDIQLLLSLENIASNPNDPYYIKQDIQW